MADTGGAPKTGLAGLVANSSQAQPLDEHQAKAVQYGLEADTAQRESDRANSASGIVRQAGRDILDFSTAPARNAASFVSDNAERLFPSTAQTVRELGADPLSLKADPRKALSDVWNNLKTTVQNQQQTLRDTQDPEKTKTVADRIAVGSRELKGYGDIVLSPITSVFTAANDIPILSSFAKIISLPFNVAGDAGKDVGKQAVKDLPISQEAKDKISPGIEDIFALAAQIVVGGKISEGVKDSLVKKYGATDAATIEKKAQEMADAHRGHDEGVKAQGEAVSHPGIESLVASSSAGDGNTVYSGARGDRTTFHTPDLETAQRHAKIAGATEVTKADISGKNILEVSPENMQKAIEDPANREKYDGVKFQVEGEPHPTYALFDKAAEEVATPSVIDQETAGNIMDAYGTDGMTEQELSDIISKKAGIDSAVADTIAESAKILKNEGGTPDGKWLTEAIKNPTGESSNLNTNKAAISQLKSNPYSRVQRFEEPDVETSFDKPQGLYTTPSSVESPHSDLGGKKAEYDIKPDAKILTVNSDTGKVGVRGLESEAAGARIIDKLASPEIKQELANADTIQKTKEILFRDFPELKDNPNLKFYDVQDVQEAYAGMLARKEGYDIVHNLTDKTDKLSKQFEETVILNKEAVTPVQEGEKATSALAENTRTRAIEAGIEADFGDLPEYTKMNMADEAAKADSLVNTDMERALRIAEMKETPGAGDPRAASVYKALELKADAEGNAELALRLAKSPLATEMSVKGQEIKALDRGGRDTTVKAIKDIQEERQKAAEKRNGKSAKKETDSTIKEAKKAKDSVKVTKQTWSEFIEQIKCNY